MLNLLTKTLTLITLASFTLCMQSNVARADESTIQPHTSLDYQLFQLKSDRANVKKGGPIAGVVISSVVLTAGIAGLAIAAGSEEDDPTCNPETSWFGCGEDNVFDEINEAGKITAGVMAGIGAVGLTVSAIKLHKRKQQQRDLDRRIQELQAESTRVSVSYGGAQKPAMLRF